MKLKSYFKARKVKVPDMAQRLKISKQHLYEILRGEAFPSRKLALRIEQETGGVVKSAELLFPEAK